MHEFDYLKNSLVFQMSLHSKELFHSNVWAWLIQQDHSFIKAFFTEQQDKILEDYNILEIKREYKHRDIIINLQKKGGNGGEEDQYYLVIENKIKSLPTISQLENYTEDIDNKKLLGAVFTGIVNPFNEEIRFTLNGRLIKWLYIDYAKIANDIRQIAQISINKNIKANINLINEYCTIIDYMGIILKEGLKNSENRLKYDCNELNELRINDLYLKMKGSNFINYVNNRKMELPELNGFQLRIDQGFNNGKVTLDFRLSNWENNDKSWLLLGIQIEGYQYRLVAERDRKTKNCQEVFDEFKDKWFSGLSKSNSMRNDYCQYCTPIYSFVYVYNILSDENNSYEDIFERIKRDLNKAVEILKEYNEV